MYRLPPIYEYENYNEIGTQLLIPYMNNSEIRHYFTKYRRLVNIKLAKEISNKTIYLDLEFIEYVSLGLIHFLHAILWNDIIPDIIFEAKGKKIQVPYMSTQTFKDLIFFMPSKLLDYLLSDSTLPRKNSEEIFKTYWERDGDKLTEILNQLDSKQFCIDIAIIEYFKNIQELFFSERIITDAFKTNPYDFNDFEFKLNQIINLLNFLNSESKNSKLKFITSFATKGNVRFFISKLNSLISSTQEITPERIRNCAVNIYTLYYFIKKIFEAYYVDDPNHILLKYFNLIKNIENYNKFEISLSDDEHKKIAKNIKSTWNDFIKSADIEKTLKLSESTETLITGLQKLGRPDAFEYSVNSRVDDFLLYLYEEYAANYPNLSKESFFYCFGPSIKKPEDYPKIIYWKGSKVDFLIFIRSLYKMNTTWSMSDIFVHVKDVKKGRTDWTGGVSLTQHTHEGKVNKIIHNANRFGAIYKGDGIPWLRSKE